MKGQDVGDYGTLTTFTVLRGSMFSSLTKKLGWFLVLALGLQFHLCPMDSSMAVQAMNGMDDPSVSMAIGTPELSCPTPLPGSAPNCCLHCAVVSPVAVFLPQTSGDANAAAIATIPTCHFFEGQHTGPAPPLSEHWHDATALAHLKSIVIIS